MRISNGTSTALCAAGLIMAAIQPAAAADQAAVVKAPVAVPAVVCTNLNWSHGWLDHGGWGGWGYYDGLAVNGWAGSCSVAVGVGPYAYAAREAAKDRAKR